MTEWCDLENFDLDGTLDAVGTLDRLVTLADGTTVVADWKASTGTAMHQLAERADRGEP